MNLFSGIKNIKPAISEQSENMQDVDEKLEKL